MGDPFHQGDMNMKQDTYALLMREIQDLRATVNFQRKQLTAQVKAIAYLTRALEAIQKEQTPPLVCATGGDPCPSCVTSGMCLALEDAKDFNSEPKIITDDVPDDVPDGHDCTHAKFDQTCGFCRARGRGHDESLSDPAPMCARCGGLSHWVNTEMTKAGLCDDCKGETS